MSDIDTGVADSLKVLDPDGRLEKRALIKSLSPIASLSKGALFFCRGSHAITSTEPLPRWYRQRTSHSAGSRGAPLTFRPHAASARKHRLHCARNVRLAARSDVALLSRAGKGPPRYPVQRPYRGRRSSPMPARWGLKESCRNGRTRPIVRGVRPTGSK